MKEITIVGGGSSAHTIIPFLKESNYKINLLVNDPENWDKNIKTLHIDPRGELLKTYKGEINKITSEPYEVIPQSEIIFLCLPVHAYREVLDRIFPYVDSKKKTFIGTIYGQGGFNWMVDEVKSKYGDKNIVTFAFGLIPWICRTKVHGSIGITYGPKYNNIIAIDNTEDFNYLNENFLYHLSEKWFNQGKFNFTNNFLSITLSADNQIIHTSRIYDLAKTFKNGWSNEEEIPLFYKDYTESSADALLKIDDEYTLIRKKLVNLYKYVEFTYMLDYLSLEKFSYQSENEDILSSFVNSKTLGQIKTPTMGLSNRFFIDKNHRFFTDDIYYGLLIAKWFAEKLNIETPKIDDILYWSQDILGESFLVNGKLKISKTQINKVGVPSVYGYKNIDEIILKDNKGSE